MRVEFEIPDLDLNVEEIKLLLAIKLFEEEKITLGKAAEIAGYSEKTFAELLLRKGITPIKYKNLNLSEEPANA